MRGPASESDRNADRTAAGVFGRCLRREREEAGLTRAAVADRTGISTSYLGRIERGTANPTLETMAALAEAVDGEIADMLSTEA